MVEYVSLKHEKPPSVVEAEENEVMVWICLSGMARCMMTRGGCIAHSRGTSLHNLNSLLGEYPPNMNCGEYVLPK